MLGGSVTVGLLATGQSTKQITKEVKSLEMDEERQDETVRLLKKWKKDGKAFWKADQKSMKKVLKLMKKYETTPGELQDLIDRQDQNADEHDKTLLDTRFALKEQLTREEWDAVFKNDQ
jgi:hypothetical protein